jgi:hypothetical protein
MGALIRTLTRFFSRVSNFCLSSQAGDPSSIRHTSQASENWTRLTAPIRINPRSFWGKAVSTRS